MFNYQRVLHQLLSDCNIQLITLFETQMFNPIWCDLEDDVDCIWIPSDFFRCAPNFTRLFYVVTVIPRTWT